MLGELMWDAKRKLIHQLPTRIVRKAWVGGTLESRRCLLWAAFCNGTTSSIGRNQWQFCAKHGATHCALYRPAQQLSLGVMRPNNIPGRTGTDYLFWYVFRCS